MPVNWLAAAARFLRPSPAVAPAVPVVAAAASATPPAAVPEFVASHRYVEDEGTAAYRARLIREIEAEGADCAAAHRLILREIANLPDPDYREHAAHHVVRYLSTYALTPKGPGILVDIAASSIYGVPLQTLKGWEIRSIPVLSFDYESQRLPFADESVDGVLICEVIEHFTVDPLHCFIEINRILKPNGFVVVTTPNAASWYSIYRALNQEHPSRWPVYALDEGRRLNHIHAREYLAAEVEQLLGGAGFDRITTFTRDYAIQPAFRPIPGASAEHRGETIFSLGYKVGPPRKRALRPLYVEDVDFSLPSGRPP
jgi:SAM-dependent methyltransferase